MYQVIKRDGRIVDFDLSKIVAAIQKAYEAEREIDGEIQDVLDSIVDGLTEEEQRLLLEMLQERKQEVSTYRKRLVQKFNSILRCIWMKRNAGAGRSNTSAVSDMMLLTIPTPPTAEAANRSLWQRGMANGAAA